MGQAVSLPAGAIDSLHVLSASQGHAVSGMFGCMLFGDSREGRQRG